MKFKINMIGLITSQLPEMKHFYEEVMGMEVIFETDNYVEFAHEGVRFALSTHGVMHETTRHESFRVSTTGQRIELAFRASSREGVDKQLGQIIDKGATLIREAHDTPWGHRTGFFADPDGNIHEIFFGE